VGVDAVEEPGEPGFGGGGLGGQGLGRTGVGPVRTADPRGPTMRQLTRVFDPALVKLLVPGMVTTR
jgi:phospholipid/cholesterol/gamma-HCH transport system substrate-binding protein